MDIAALTQEIMRDLCARFPLGYTPSVHWKGYRVSAGMAYYQKRSIGLSRIVIDDEEKLRSTLVHEYAHLLAYVRCGKVGIGHGAAWQQAMRDMGQEPVVRHCYAVARNMRRQEVAYLCQKCGRLLIRSKKLPRKRRYVHRSCGGAIKYAWTRAVTPQAAMA